MDEKEKANDVHYIGKLSKTKSWRTCVEKQNVIFFKTNGFNVVNKINN